MEDHAAWCGELRQRSSLPPLFVNVVLALFMQTASKSYQHR
jgi:hypothetical protein